MRANQSGETRRAPPVCWLDAQAPRRAGRNPSSCPSRAIERDDATPRRGSAGEPARRGRRRERRAGDDHLARRPGDARERPRHVLPADVDGSRGCAGDREGGDVAATHRGDTAAATSRRRITATPRQRRRGDASRRHRGGDSRIPRSRRPTATTRIVRGLCFVADACRGRDASTRAGRPIVKATSAYLKLGGRLVDTAQAYRNHKEIGQVIGGSGVPREDMWITSKVASGRVTTFDQAVAAVDSILSELDTPYDGRADILPVGPRFAFSLKSLSLRVRSRPQVSGLAPHSLAEDGRSQGDTSMEGPHRGEEGR